MSRKRTAGDVQGHAQIPADLLTPTLGSNYGLDGYEDLQYNSGVLEGVLEPTLTDPPALPTGLTKGAAADMDLTAMLEESLVDLDWLDPTQLQDPDRLPKNPVNLAIPELEEAWGVNRRTDGLKVYARDLNQARYEDSLKRSSSGKKASAKQLEQVATHAMRRSVAHQNIDTIVKEALESMGEEMGRVAHLLKAVREDHGLAGNVFVRASAFPSYGGGKWTSFIKKYASGARYLIVSPEDLKQATWIQNGRCTHTGKRAVLQVPWEEAWKHYAPLLELSGRKAASVGDRRKALREAFLSLPEKGVSQRDFPMDPHRLRNQDG